MVTVADLAAGAAGAAAVLSLVLTGLALRAWQRTRSRRNLLLGIAFAVSTAEAGLMAFLLQRQADLPTAWLAVPGAHAGAMLVMYLALLRV